MIVDPDLMTVDPDSITVDLDSMTGDPDSMTVDPDSESGSRIQEHENEQKKSTFQNIFFNFITKRSVVHPDPHWIWIQ
jgi:hypothetical protein